MMNAGSMSDRLREAMEEKGREENGTLMGQFASTIRREQADNGEMKEFVWVNKSEELDFDAPDEEWQHTPGSFKVYGNWNEYAQGQDEEGNMYIFDDDYPYINNSDWQYVIDESTFEGRMKGIETERKAQGGPGESRTGDLMEILNQMRGPGGQPAPGRQMGMGGKIYKKGGKFPDLNKDGKITMADILMGRGVRR